MRIAYIPAAVIAITLLISTNSSIGQTMPQSRCLSYEPAVVTLSGSLVCKTFPGPPNYESVKKGDKPETSWFLDLTEKVCINEDKAEPDLNPKESGIHEIQLVLRPEQYQQNKREWWAGRSLRLEPCSESIRHIITPPCSLPSAHCTKRGNDRSDSTVDNRPLHTLARLAALSADYGRLSNFTTTTIVRRTSKRPANERIVPWDRYCFILGILEHLLLESCATILG